MSRTPWKRSRRKSPSTEANLEKILQPNLIWPEKFMSLGILEELGKTVKPCVCRIEAPLIGLPLGSGFLIAPGLVLTNYHVLNAVPGNDNIAAKCTRLEFRFDFTEFNNVKNPGFIVKAQKEGSLLAFSPITDLDYALIRLDEILYDIAGIPISLLSRISPDKEPTLNKPIFVLQHPLGDPMLMGWGKIISALPGTRMFQYDANTDKGSSGAPVLDSELNLIGLHRKGDANLGNEGVVLKEILSQIQQFIDEAKSIPQKPQNPFPGLDPLDSIIFQAACRLALEQHTPCTSSSRGRRYTHTGSVAA